MKLLSLDFDGVLADSARECFTVACRSWRALRSEPLREDESLYRAFLALLPLGNRAEDFGVALAAIAAGVAIEDQPAYDAWFAAQDPGWLRAFHERFYAERRALFADDPQAWRTLVAPYAGFLAILRRRAGSCRYAIATAKDRSSVLDLLAAYGVADLFDPALVLDKETGVTKLAHHRHLAAATGVPFAETTFVDDKANHLDAVSTLGVRCVLAAWGFNGPREWQLARDRGHRVCTLDDFEAQVFDAAAPEADGLQRGAARADGS